MNVRFKHSTEQNVIQTQSEQTSQISPLLNNYVQTNLNVRYKHSTEHNVIQIQSEQISQIIERERVRERVRERGIPL